LSTASAVLLTFQTKGDTNLKTFWRFGAWALTTAITSAVGFAQHYTQTNLVSNTAGTAPGTDAQLINSWGLARGSGSAWWVSDNAAGVITLYNGSGEKQSLIVTIPPADPSKTQLGSPTASIFNGSATEFVLTPGNPAAFLFCTVDGTVAGWNANVAVAPGAAPPSTHAVTVLKATDGSAFTGITSALINGKRYLYLANFSKGRVDVYDNAFQPVDLSKQGSNGESSEDGDNSDRPFFDSSLPSSYVPFNVHAVGNDIVVTYALLQRGSQLETDGPGLGFVDIYSSTGVLLRRLEHGDWLNAPWGVALAPLDFGRFSHDLLIGQFAGGGDTQSSGFIAAYDLATGKLDGLLQDASGKPLSISGLWSLSPANVSSANADPNAAPAAQVYFTAGPHAQSGGLFGYLTAASTDLIEGNAQ
jgi:uncharacterized protein (TIGR03118 family)